MAPCFVASPVILNGFTGSQKVKKYPYHAKSHNKCHGTYGGSGLRGTRFINFMRAKAIQKHKKPVEVSQILNG